MTMVEETTKKKQTPKPKRKPSKENPFQHFNDDFHGVFTESEYQKADDKFRFVSDYYHSLYFCSIEYFRDSSSDRDGIVPVPKWAFMAVAAYSDSIRPLFRQESGHCSGRKAAGIPF